MVKYLLLKDGSIVCEYGYNGTEVVYYDQSQRKLPVDQRKYKSTCLSQVVQSDTNITVLGGKL